MDAENIIEPRFGAESESQCAGWIEIARPARDDAFDHWVALVPNALHHPFAANAPQRFDLLPHSAGKPWHREIATRANLSSYKIGGVNEETDR
jgi:hypothetical protein